MTEKCQNCGTEMMDGYYKCPKCGSLKRVVTIEDTLSLRDDINVIKKEIQEVKEAFKWNDVRLGALQIFIGAFLAIYLTFVHDTTNTLLLALISLGISSIMVFLLMGVGRKATMVLMDTLTLAYWKNPNRKK